MATILPEGRPIRDTQAALRLISGKYPEIPRIIPDGIFGPETTDAVTAFQRRFGLDPSGIVDKPTWDRIFEVKGIVLFERSEPLELHSFPCRDCEIGPGDTDDIVVILQLILKRMGEVYGDFDPIPLSAVYDTETARSVQRFQRRALLEESGRTDKKTWNRLARWYDLNRPGRDSARPD